jgi:hypothetical protein
LHVGGAYRSRYGGIHLWDLKQARMLAHPGFSHHGGTANRAVFGHTGNYVVTSDELYSCLWYVENGQLNPLGRFYHSKLTGLDDRPSAVAFSPDDEEIAFGTGQAVGLIERRSMRLVGYLGKERAAKVESGDADSPVETRPCAD